MTVDDDAATTVGETSNATGDAFSGVAIGIAVPVFLPANLAHYR